MNDESFEQIEQQIVGAGTLGAPTELRAAVLGGMQRELRAARWDRRLARAAVVLLVVGVGMNVASERFSRGAGGVARPQIARGDAQQSLVETAIVVAEATDPATGSRFARQLAAMSGHDLTLDERAAIEAALRRAAVNGNRG
jgi:hypothetical protein